MRRSSDPQPELGAAIRTLRREAEMTQEALAEAAGITVSHLSAIEGGHSNPKWSTVKAIASGLGASMMDVVARSEAST